MSTIICDGAGVPLLVQRIQYYASSDTVSVLFFNGQTKRFSLSSVCPGWEEGQPPPRVGHMVDVDAYITHLAKTMWKRWFPLNYTEGGLKIV
jgi:hypothetical protein